MKDENYPSLGGGDKRSEILRVRWNGWKIRNAEGYAARIQDRYYSRLGGTDHRLEIFKVSRKD